ncbi:TetR/AcrR family transcriptional regulator [Streptomyces sp. NPDC047990]|uniref:TetR/AcrR family transcriptional regulator n=1 Tax=Streptomyces sp. NPDC047990 TaxID=3365496 RepID=UPI00371D900F
MTKATGRGRVRDETKRAAILSAALEIVETDGLGKLSMEGIAARAGVSKVTLYRWWSHPGEVLIDGLLDAVEPSLAWRDTGDFVHDWGRQLNAVVRFLNGPHGTVARAVVGAAQADEGVRKAYLTRFHLPRRTEIRSRVEEAVNRGQLAPETDADTLMDLVYGALYYRLLIGHLPLTPRRTGQILAMALHGTGPQPARG